jgi:glycosyltransferase involved in cell wall biosynthesis
LVYLSPVSWQTFAQRPHKFVRWYHEQTGGDVLWVEPYPTRLPSISDLCRLRHTSTSASTPQPSWLKVVTPPAVPLEPIPGAILLSRVLWRKILNEAKEFATNLPCVIGIGKPSMLALEMLDQMDGSTSIYDAMDDFPAFYSGLSRSTMQATEQKLAHRVSHMLVSSTALKNRWATVRPDVQHIPNGLDHRLMSQAVPRKKGLKRIFGYVGTIADWFDWEWVISLAHIRSSDLIRLIGPIFTPVPNALPPNIEIHPALPHHDALNAMQDFDVGLIPFRQSPLTESVDPIKYYEYRALGIPVLSTDFGEMRYRLSEPGVYISQRGRDSEFCSEKALQYCQSETDTLEFIARNSWESRFHSVALLFPREISN